MAGTYFFHEIKLTRVVMASKSHATNGKGQREKASDRPSILCIGNEEGSLVEMIMPLMSAVQDKYYVVDAKSKNSCTKEMKNVQRYAAVLILGAKAANNANVQQLLRKYVTEDGGTAIACGFFPNFMEMPQVDAFFRNAFGLKWTHGPYFRTTFSLNARSILCNGASSSQLCRSYSMKALQLSGVKPEEAVYHATSESHIESFVFPPDRVPANNGDAPAAFTRVGRGYVGYVGDVNMEAATTPVILAMCNYALQQKGSTSVAATPTASNATAGTTTTPATTPSTTKVSTATASTTTAIPVATQAPHQEKKLTGQCAVCDKTSNQRCGRCRSIFYCSVDHQRQHWSQHKPNCGQQLTQQQQPQSQPSSSLPSGKPNFLDNPSWWTQAIPPQKQHEWLVDCYRMRLDDEYAYSGELRGLYNPDAEREDIVYDFALFCRLVKRRGVVPAGWDWAKTLLAAAKLLPYALEKSDAQTKWGGENVFSMIQGQPSLRFTAETIYGTSVLNAMYAQDSVFQEERDNVDSAFARVLERGGNLKGPALDKLLADIGTTDAWNGLLRALHNSPY